MNEKIREYGLRGAEAKKKARDTGRTKNDHVAFS